LIQGAAEGLLADLKTFLEDPAEEVSVVVRIPNLVGHNGKVAKEVGPKALTVACEELKRENDKLDFVRKEFQRAGLTIDQGAVRALVGSFNTDLGELGAACSQLIARGQPVSGAVVESIFGGRVETNAFKIADAALSGNTAEAIKLFRHGFSTGLDSVALVAALSMRIRQLAKIFNNRNAQPAVLGMQPWQIDKARKELAGWSEAELADLVELCAQVDADVKGASRDPEYSIEKLLLAMSRAK
jgi:DNA polymerase-3 subunit delta